MVADHVERTRDRVGSNRNATGERFELHDAERVGLAREHENIRRRDQAGQFRTFLEAEEFRRRESLLQFGHLRPVANHHLAAGQIEREERRQVFLDRDPAPP